MRTLTLLVLLLFVLPATAQKVLVGIYYDIPLRAVVFAPSYGQYQVVAGGKTTDLDYRYSVKIQPSGDSIRLTFHDGTYVVTDEARISSQNRYAYFRISHNLKPTSYRLYDDGLRIRNRFGNLLLINEVDMDDYLCGVIEKEAGKKKHPDFFKTQAVLCRTYWAKARSNHLSEGFELCDGVHCQAFMGRSSAVPAIVEAVAATDDMIVCDTTGKPVTAVFHSNCGGQTEAAENVWSTARPYLKPVADPWCNSSPSARWTKEIPISEWTKYLRNNGFKTDSISDPAQYGFTQEKRMRYYRVGNDSVPFVKMRNELKLKSAWFSVVPEGDQVKLYGRGFGHGVGMCQEGAMQMAKNGKSFEDILHFYFSGVLIYSAIETEVLYPPKNLPTNTSQP